MASYLGNLRNSQSPGRSQDNLPIRPEPTGLFIPAGSGAYRFGNMPTLQFDTSFGRDLSLEEAVKRLQEIMNENQDLKTILRDNNTVMKSLQNALLDMKAKWDSERDEFLKKHEQARSVVMTIKKDADSKKTQIEELEIQLKQSMSSNLTQNMESLQSELASCRLNLSQLKKEKELTSKELDNMKIKFDQAEAKATAMKEEIQKKENEMKSINVECETLQDKMSQLVQHNRKLSENGQKEKKELVAVNNDLQMQLDRLKQSIVTSYGPESVAVMMKSSLVLESSSRDSSLEKQTHSKYLFSGELTQDEEAEAEKKSLAKYESEMWGEKTEKTELVAQLQREQQKVLDFEKKIRELNLALETSNQELQLKDASLTHLRISLDGQMKQLQTEHAAREEQMKRELDNLQRYPPQPHSFQGQSQVDSIGNIKAQVISLLHELQESNRHLEVANNRAHQYKQKCDELSQRCSHAQQELETQRSKDDHLIEALRGAVANTESSLATQKELVDKKGSIIEENTIEIQELKKECSTLKYQLEQLKKKHSTGNVMMSSDGQTITLTIIQKRELDEKIDSLTARLLGMEDTLMAKQEEIQKLQQKVILLRTESEDIPYLKAQAESYKTDFEIQRKMCMSLQREKAQLHEEVENARLLNNQLRDQLDQLSTLQRRNSPGQNWGSGSLSSRAWERDTMRGRPYPGGGYDECDQKREVNTSMQGFLVPDTSPARMPTEHSTQRPVHPKRSASPGRNQYECPKCGLTTQDMDSISIHIEDCMQDT